MKLLFEATPESNVAVDALIVPLLEEPTVEQATHLSVLPQNLAAAVIGTKEFAGKLSQIVLVHVPELPARRVLLVGLGTSAEVTAERARQAGGKALAFLRDIGATNIAIATGLFADLPGTVEGGMFRCFLEGGLLGLYRFDRYKTSSESSAPMLQTITILQDGPNFSTPMLEATVAAVHFARDLVNMPPNEKTPTMLAALARDLADDQTTVAVLGSEEAKNEGMGAYLSVAQGSREPAQFIVIHYQGSTDQPVVLVGKTVTFDSGGISLKPSEGMERMKYDMGGGAAVLGVVKAVSVLRLPLNLIAVLPATENLPGGRASKPGDVVKTVTGKTVEIISTDAEGRLTLADGIGYALKYYKPQAIIDIATLTGACSIALGSEACAMFGNDRQLLDRFREAAKETGERVWEMPLFEEYGEYLKSEVADMKNSGGRKGSLVAAGFFLKEFVGATPWVHLDIACTAWSDKDKAYTPKGGTGFGVRLMLRVLSGLSA